MGVKAPRICCHIEESAQQNVRIVAGYSGQGPRQMLLVSTFQQLRLEVFNLLDN
jgi:hypothetical protein